MSASAGAASCEVDMSPGVVGGGSNFTASETEKNNAIRNGMRFVRVEGYIWNQPVPKVAPPGPRIETGKKSIDADTDLLNRGCTRSAIGVYVCDAVGAYEACVTYRNAGKAKNCVLLGSLAQQKEMDQKLFSLGCVRFLGRPDEYICKTPKSFEACEVYRKNGKAKRCVKPRQY